MERKERLQKIDDFFEKSSVEEFDEVLIKAGILDLKQSEDFKLAPSQLEIEKKFLVKCEEPKALLEEKYEQGYIVDKKGYEERVRKKTIGSSVEYIWTSKEDTDSLDTRVENERIISEEEYNKLAKSIKKSISKVRKTYKTDDDMIFTLDIYSDGMKIVEIELDNSEQFFKFPEWVRIIEDVTGQKKYKNINLAKPVAKYLG